MESELSLCETDLRFYFVTQDGEPDLNLTELNLCFEKISERFQTGDNYEWVSENECIRLATATILSNRSVFVFNEFETPAFEKLRKTDAMIVGPKCVISCLVNEYGVPNSHSPVYNVLLRERLVCSSGLSTTEKDKVQKLVHFMGGHFQRNELTEDTSYLVTNTVLSQKYEKAVVHSIHTVTPDWVDQLWTRSQRDAIDSSTLDQLDARCKIPHFYKLGITSTGITGSKKTQIKQLVESNGGKFFGAFKSELIDVLIATADNTTSDKFRAAVKCRKMCLTPEWITDSVAKGYALPYDAYRLDGTAETRSNVFVSTPTRQSTAINESAFNANCTNLSEIASNMTVNESVAPLKSGKTKADHAYKALLANMNVQQAKKAGLFLDGCNIFVCGFTSEEKEKISKILGFSNATRFQEYESRVEYIIVGHPNIAEVQLLSGLKTSCSMVTLEWLAESIALKQPANERPYLFRLTAAHAVKCSPEQDAPTVASPASKKNIQSMNNSFRKPIPRRLEMDETATAADANEESDLLQQYLVPPPEQPMPPPELPTPPSAPTRPAVATPSATAAAPVRVSSGSADRASTTNEEDESNFENLEIFQGLKFHLHGFSEESEEELQSEIELGCGELVPSTYKGVVDYLLVPTDIMEIQVKIKATHIVNEYWIEDAIGTQTIVDIGYFHKPFDWDESLTPLTGLTLVLTTYSGSERKYLMHVGQMLGATVVDRYVKNMKPILICPKPEGAKYNGAINWKLPVVSCDWLLSCASAKRKVAMRPYLVGNSIVPADEEEDVELPPIDLDSGPITSTANPLSDASKMENDISPIRPKEAKHTPTTETAQKRPRNDDFNTPVLKHRRLSEIAGLGSRTASPLSSQSPQISGQDMLRDIYNDFPTPERNVILNVMKQHEQDTPETRRRLEAISTPDLLRSPVPREWRTPARQERMRAINNMHVLPPLPTPPPTTPYAEIQRRFWKKALGELYVSPTQQMSESILINQENDADLAPANNVASSTQAAASSAAAHAQLKRLSDFIENNKGTPAKHVEEVPESMAMPTQIASTEINSEGTEAVGWVDPTDFYDNHRFRHQDKMQHVGTPKFNLSSSDMVMLERMITQIVELKGEICENRSGYDPECTHIVCEKPSRSEKIFSAIAAGKWLLSPKYIEDSVAAGHFLNEEAYEWGNPKAAENVPQVDSTGQAAHRWRKQLQAEAAKSSAPVGAFSTFRVILHTKKKASFKNLLEAGAGCVLDVSEPYETSKDALTATHCILDAKNRLSSVDQKALKRANVLCVNIAYLQAYITSDTVPNPDDFAA